jgi:hypothetical protein
MLERRPMLAVALAMATVLAMAPASVSTAEPQARPARPATPALIERAVGRGEISEAEGALLLTWAFTDPGRVPEAYVSDRPWSGTLPLLGLQETLPTLGDAPAARVARAELRGPTFACPGTRGALPHTRSSRHFYLQYRASSLVSLTVAKYAATLDAAWQTEIRRFGWARPPRRPGRRPPGGRYPVRIENLSAGLYGFVSGTAVVGNNPATPWSDHDAVASCMVLNRNFAQFPGSPLDALRATAAHEFNHAIQFGYGALTGPGKATDVLVEGLATEMEDEVFDSSNDSYNYLWPRFTVPMGRYGGSPYPYWVVFRAMAERFGTGRRGGSEDVYEAFWEQVSRGTSTNLAALARAFKTTRITLSEAYHDASIALRFLQGCSDTKRRYCLEEGPQYAAARGGNADHAALASPPDSVTRSIANDYALNWIGLPVDGTYDLEVVHERGRGRLRVSVACRRGTGVRVTPVGLAKASSDTGLTFTPGPCDEVSAVVSNVKQTAPTPTSITKTRYTISIT